MTHKVKWAVSLSNGETIYEDKGDFLEIDNQLSPWQRLMTHLRETKSSITSLFLYSDDGQRWNLPSHGKNPRFKAFSDAPKPIDYNAFRRIGADVLGTNVKPEEINNADLFTVAEAIYPNHKLQIWVNEKNPKVSWVLVVN